MKPQGKAAKKVAAELHILHRQSFVNAAMEFLLRLYKVAGLVVHELRTPVDLSLRHSIRAWRYGFARRNYRMYALDLSGDPLDYISDHESIRLLTINGIFTEIIKNKLIFPLLMKHYGMPTPKIKGLIRKGIFISFDAATKLKPAAFLDTLREPGERIIIKPVCGKHGLGFLKVAREKEGYLLNGEGLPTGILADMIGKLDNYLVTEFVQQSEYGSRLYSDTTNTIRIVTFWDVEKSEPFIAKVVQRIGTYRSHPVDNFKAGHGGMSALVDPHSCELGPGAMVSNKGRSTWHSHHPENQAPIQGIVVPSWPEMRRSILEYATRFPFAPCIGWDIVPTSSGFTIIEGNAHPGMPVLQVHGPMLIDKRISRFFKHHRVIR